MSDESSKQVLGVSWLGAPIRIEVFGRPRTKGSLRPIHMKIGPGRCRVSLTEDGEYSTPWKNEMIRAIRNQCEMTRYAGPVVIDCYFRFEKLASQVRRGELWPVAKSGATAHGDEDKLRRNVLDALVQAGLILDDCLSVGGQTFKRYADVGERPGVLIKVQPAPTGDAGIRRMEQMP